MHRSLRILALVVALAVVSAACSSDDTPDDGSTRSTTAADEPDESAATTTTTEAPAPPAVPTVSGPVTATRGPVLPQPAAALPEEYVEEEFFIGGDATSFAALGELPADGMWTVVPEESAAYRTRVLVRRPPADRFSGTVVVEWLNVTAIEASPDWGYLVEEIGRAGHAYVAVSAQALGVVGSESVLSVEVDEGAAAEAGEAPPSNETGLVNIDPERYGDLAHPGDAYAFDIYSQVGMALEGGVGAILGDLDATNLLAVGESQSAGFLTTYLNAIHPTAGVYDGFLVHSRAAGSAALHGRFEGDESFVSDGVRIRDDLSEPVFILQTETDLTLLGYSLARQDDTETIRTWEVAGTAHSDAHVLRSILGGARSNDNGNLIGCENPINTGPHHEAAQAALSHLAGWAQGGDAPPAADRIELVEGDPVAIARDELGRAIGGVRNPLVDVPVVVTTGDPWGDDPIESAEDFDVCDLFGRTIALDQATLVELHGSADDYVAAFNASADDAVAAGFLLPGDADQLRAEAEENWALFD